MRDTSSQRLEIRSLSLNECPTCHQPFRPAHHQGDRAVPPTHHDPNYVDPDYFRMLRHRMPLEDDPSSASSESTTTTTTASTATPAPASRHARSHSRDLGFPVLPSSPIMRLAQQAGERAGGGGGPSLNGGYGGNGGRIRREAFMPDYFRTFFKEEAVLGKGGKGVVLLVRHEIDGCHLGHYACKRVPVGDNHEWLEKGGQFVSMSMRKLLSYAYIYIYMYMHTITCTLSH